MKDAPKLSLTEDDLRYELRVMERWCRLFHKSDFDWVDLEAERFRRRHPIVALDAPHTRAA